MSYAEAVVDGVERFFDENYLARGKKGAYVYRIPCQKCGKTFLKTVYRRDINNFCETCKCVVSRKIKALPKYVDSVETKEERRFRKAVEEMKKQCNNFDCYDNAVKIAKTKLYLYGSIPEVIVAIELIKLGYSIIPQQKVGKYKVDFAIPNQKIVIEIDGYPFHSLKNNEREATIQFSLGLDWKIIHIPAEKVRKDFRKLQKIIDCF